MTEKAVSRFGHAISAQRAMTTEHLARLDTAIDTLPMRTPFAPVIPRLPVTMSRGL